MNKNSFGYVELVRTNLGLHSLLLASIWNYIQTCSVLFRPWLTRDSVNQLILLVI
jgi:hypothetical protein